MKALRRLFSRLYRSYGFCWDLKSLSRAKAMASVAQTTEPDKFWEDGRAIAASLTQYFGKDSVVLDFGCGIGRVAKYIAPHWKELWCADTSARMLKLASESLRGLENVRFVRKGV